MPIASMFARSLIGYLIYLSVRKGVNSIPILANKAKITLELRRCSRCWAITSGKAEQCPRCKSIMGAMYDEEGNPTTLAKYKDKKKRGVYDRDSNSGVSKPSEPNKRRSIGFSGENEPY